MRREEEEGTRRGRGRKGEGRRKGRNGGGEGGLHATRNHPDSAAGTRSLQSGNCPWSGTMQTML